MYTRDDEDNNDIPVIWERYTQQGTGILGDFLSGRPSTYLKNIIPASDNNARPQFVGEKHVPQLLPNGKIGIANFAGPGTNVVARLQRGDPPRTAVDAVAKAHDLRFTLAKNNADMRQADHKMINKLKQLERSGRANPVNVKIAKNAIEAKVFLEDRGLSRNTFASPGMSDSALVRDELREMEQAGYGGKSKKPPLPADELKAKLYRMLKAEQRKLDQSVQSGNGFGELLKQVNKALGKPVTQKQMETFHKKVAGKSPQELVKELIGATLKIHGKPLKYIPQILKTEPAKQLVNQLSGSGICDMCGGSFKSFIKSKGFRKGLKTSIDYGIKLAPIILPLVV